MSQVLNAQLQPHRGRVQAQGGRPKLEESESWAQAVALLLSEGQALLEALRKKIGPAERQKRELAFVQAKDYMENVAQAGGTGPDKKSFPKGKIRRTDPRVDVEIHKGMAFVLAR